MTILPKNIFFPDQPEIVAKNAIAAFFKQSIDDISCKPLTGGSIEGAIIKCTHMTTSYVVKFFSTSETGINEIAWTQLAWNLGIGPQLYYAEPTGKYMITEFVEGHSLIPATANKKSVIQHVAANIKRLHHSSAPFAHKSNTLARIEEKYKKLRCSGKLKHILDNVWDAIKNIEAELQKFSISSAPCHNDLNWGNIFENKNRAILIDWGDASLGNPYYDIAIFFVLNVIEADNQKLFFKQYDAKLLTPRWQEYIQLCKQLLYFEFALNLLGGVQAGNSELLHAHDISQSDNLSYYLTLLAQKEVTVDSDFLYNTAIASLSEFLRNTQTRISQYVE